MDLSVFFFKEISLQISRHEFHKKFPHKLFEGDFLGYFLNYTMNYFRNSSIIVSFFRDFFRTFCENSFRNSFRIFFRGSLRHSFRYFLRKFTRDFTGIASENPLKVLTRVCPSISSGIHLKNPAEFLTLLLQKFRHELLHRYLPQEFIQR